MTSLTCMLFDIDGTLLSSGGAGRKAFSNALATVFGWNDLIEYVRFAGATDLRVLDEIVERQGHALRDGERERFFDALAVELETTIRSNEPALLDGTHEVLTELAAAEQVLLGLVTGNVEPCARIKLRRFGLDHFFSFGGFGQDHADRDEIARVALGRAADQVGPGRAIGRIVLVGDTPSDVRAARAIGGTSVAVTTGMFERGALVDAGADYVIDSLRDLEGIL